ncbi:MAG: hypothetical protein O6931_08415 [Gammaproteobacteria bacterium]|jgi:hypothetical protein|nr:hypothetical protein [Gammaproteobacteria bacterium]
MKKHLVTFLFLVAAIALYAVGFALAATAFVVLGMLAEGTFWVRLLRRSHGNGT